MYNRPSPFLRKILAVCASDDVYSPVAMPPCMGVAINTIGVGTSLVGFCRGSASDSDSESTTGPLYAVDGRSNGWKAPAQDAAACVAIYRPYVEDTAISWEIEVPTADEMAARIAGLRASHEWATGTTSHGCNSSCSTVPTETQRPARSRDPPRAGELPLRKRQGAGSPGPVSGQSGVCGHRRPVRLPIDPERS